MALYEDRFQPEVIASWFTDIADFTQLPDTNSNDIPEIQPDQITHTPLSNDKSVETAILEKLGYEVLETIEETPSVNPLPEEAEPPTPVARTELAKDSNNNYSYTGGLVVIVDATEGNNTLIIGNNILTVDQFNDKEFSFYADGNNLIIEFDDDNSILIEDAVSNGSPGAGIVETISIADTNALIQRNILIQNFLDDNYQIDGSN